MQRPNRKLLITMKLTILSPQFPFSGRVPLVPPILEYLAALTHREAPGTDVSLIDANQRLISPADIPADVVAISVMTATAPWSYRFADDCRRIGKRVILGGIHPTALPDEAALHADAVVIGEAESVWGTVLADAQKGNLQRFYAGERLPLDNLPKQINADLKGNYQFRAFFTMRGCPYRCTFCSVRRFFGDTIRYRPIAAVVDEIETCAGKLWFNGDDNIWGGDLQRSTDLFNALAQGSKKQWYGFGDLRSIQSAEGAKMLAAARRSGLFSVWVGWEGEEGQLGTFNATGKQGGDRVAAVKMMQDAGIDVTLFVVLGGRQDSIDSFKRTLELSERLQVGVHPVLLTPLPGTELYEEYREHLIPGLGWESFTGVNAVFAHPSPEMTPLRREAEYHRLSNELFRFERIVNRIGKISAKGFPLTHIYSFMMQVPMKHALSKAYEDWKVQSDLRAVGGAAGGDRLVQGVSEDANAPDPLSCFESFSGFWLWIIVLFALALSFGWWVAFTSTKVIQAVQIALYAGSYVAILLQLYLSRKRLYRNMDLLIDWTGDGLARRKLLIRFAMYGLVIILVQFGGYLLVSKY